MRKYLFIFLTSLALAMAMFWSIKTPGDWYPMHDSTHLTRIILMADTMLSGQLPPIWANTLNDGLGYPLFHFYAPLFHTLATVIFMIFQTPTTALKITLFFAGFAGIFGVMKFASRWGRGAALLSGFVLAFSPYLASNLYVRGAYAEFMSLCLIPWVLLATEKLKTKKQVIFGSIVLALFVLSHNLIPIIALPLIFIWMLFHNQKSLHQLVLTLILGIGFSAWFIVPVLFERGFTQTDAIAKTTDYALHFVYPQQLWNSTWGFGGSAPGVEDGMSFKLGKIQLLLALVSLLVAWRKKNRPVLYLGSFMIITILLSLPVSKIIWDRLPLLQLVQFPWRALGLVTIFMALVSPYLLTLTSSRIWRLLLIVPLLVVLPVLNLKYFAPQSIEPSSQDDPNIALQDLPDISTTIPEYAPIWLKKSEIDLTEHLQIYMSPGINTNEASPDLQGLMPWGYQFDLIASNSGQVSVGTAYYPTWVGEIDGVVTPLSHDERGLVSVTIPAGEHRLILYQSHTFLEKIALLISVITFFIIVRIYVKL